MFAYYRRMLETPYTRWIGDRLHGRQRAVLAEVWVRLEVISGILPGAPYENIVDGLDMRGEVPGMVTGYFRGSRGEWLVVVSYEIPYVDGRGRKVRVEDQLVSFSAVRRREASDSTS
jgi:hypothetical protein